MFTSTIGKFVSCADHKTELGALFCTPCDDREISIGSGPLNTRHIQRIPPSVLMHGLAILIGHAALLICLNDSSQLQLSM